MKKQTKNKKMNLYEVFLRPWTWDVYEVKATSGKEAYQKVRNNSEGDQTCSVSSEDLPKNRRWKKIIQSD